MILWPYKLREHWRVWRARAAEERWWTVQILTWVRGQASVPAYAVALALVLTLADGTILAGRPPANVSMPLSKLYFPLFVHGRNESTWWREVVGVAQRVQRPGLDLHAIVPVGLTFGATMFFYLMASWFLVAQSAASRQASSVVVDRLTQDPISGHIIRLVATAMLVLLWALVVTPLLGITTVGLALVPLAMLGVAFLALLAYREYCLTLFNPAAIGRRIRLDAQRSIRDVAERGYPSPSIDARHQRLVAHDISVWDGLLGYAAEKDAASHRAIITAFITEVAFYLHEKFKIPADSEWFPVRKKAIPLNLNSGQQQLRHIHEAQGLGESYTRERDTFWFETKCLSVLSRAARREVRHINVRDQVMTALAVLLRSTWDRQDPELLVAIEQLWAQEQHASSMDDYNTWGGGVLNGLLQFIDDIVKSKLSLGRHLPLTEFPRMETLRASELPGIVLEELRWAATAIENERFVSARQVTPLDFVSREVESRLSKRQEAMIQAHTTWASQQLAGLVDKATAAGSPTAAVQAFHALLVVVARAWAIGVDSVAELCLELAATRIDQVSTLVPNTDYEPRRLLQQQARIVALQSIALGRPSAPAAATIALKIAAASSKADGDKLSETAPGLRPSLETVLVVGGLAFACGEIRNDRSIVNGLVREMLSLQFNLRVLAGMADAFNSPWSMMSGPARGLTLEYHRFVAPLFDEIAQLPRRPISSRLGLAMSTIATDSPWLQHRSFLSHFDITEAIVGFLHHLSAVAEAQSTDTKEDRGDE